MMNFQLREFGVKSLLVHIKNYKKCELFFEMPIKVQTACLKSFMHVNFSQCMWSICIWQNISCKFHIAFRFAFSY